MSLSIVSTEIIIHVKVGFQNFSEEFEETNLSPLSDYTAE
jgi:hypothetical protein